MFKFPIRFSLFIAIFAFFNNAKAQNISDFQKSFQYNIHATTDKIKIDGILDESIWTSTEVAKDFKKK